MLPLLTQAQMKSADAEAIQTFGLPQIVLVEHAALAVACRLELRFGTLLNQTRGIVLAGPGSNGADALAVARLLIQKGVYQVVVYSPENPENSARDTQLKVLSQLGWSWSKKLKEEDLKGVDWIVDGLFGTGLSKPLAPPFEDCVKMLTQRKQACWIVSIDIPSGLSADTGQPIGSLAVQASETVSLGFLKRGLVTASAPNYVGHLTWDPIQIPRNVRSDLWSTFLYTEEDARRLPKRAPAAHKGTFGHTHFWAGPSSLQGASLLAARGALRVGSGLTTIWVSDSNSLSELRPHTPAEIMLKVGTPPIDKPGVLVAGPGWGGDFIDEHILEALAYKGPLVLDADALSWMSQHKKESVLALSKRTEPTVLTPHPKEAAALLGTQTAWIEQDRYRAVLRLADDFPAWCVLKGRGTLIHAKGQPTIVVNQGDTGLSKGGSGDLLAGCIAGFLAQGLTPGHAISFAVWVHGKAAERLTDIQGQSRSTLASEIAESIPEVLTYIESDPPKA